MVEGYDVLIQLENVTREFDGEQVLGDVSLQLERGQSMAVVGPSGAGKSTLLSIAGLLLSPTSGRVVFEGTDVSSLTDGQRSALRAKSIGFLFQHTQLLGSLRAIENVALPAEFATSLRVNSDQVGHVRSKLLSAKLSRAKSMQRSKELLSGFGLENRLYHYPFQLSIGQKRRIATARALFMRPSLLIADEPTNDLDPKNAHIVIDALFDGMSKGECALLYATHDIELAQRADFIIRL